MAQKNKYMQQPHRLIKIYICNNLNGLENIKNKATSLHIYTPFILILLELFSRSVFKATKMQLVCTNKKNPRMKDRWSTCPTLRAGKGRWYICTWLSPAGPLVCPVSYPCSVPLPHSSPPIPVAVATQPPDSCRTPPSSSSPPPAGLSAGWPQRGASRSVSVATQSTLQRIRTKHL